MTYLLISNHFENFQSCSIRKIFKSTMNFKFVFNKNILNGITKLKVTNNVT